MEEIKKYTKAKRTKEALLASAMKLMKENGFIATTIRQICSDAGVSVGTFYTYFPTKGDIFSDIFNAADDLFVNQVAASLASLNCSTCDKIIEYFRYYAKLNIDSGIEVMKVLYNAENVWFAKARPMHDVLINIVAAGQQSGELLSDTAPYDISFFLYTLARGCCYGWCLRNGAYDLEAQLADYIGRALIIYKAKRD